MISRGRKEVVEGLNSFRTDFFLNFSINLERATLGVISVLRLRETLLLPYRKHSAAILTMFREVIIVCLVW
jgi:hypothetical protein